MTALSEKNRYQAYPEYKDSGVEWSDTLPLSWGEVNLRWISTIYAGGTPSKTNQSFWENGTVPWINSGAVNQGLVTKPSTLITEQAYQNSSAKWIPKGSLVVALAGQGKTKGMVAQLAIDSTCNQSMGAIVPECSEYSRYLYWWITSNYQNIRNMAGGDLRDGLNLEHLGSIQCPQPSIDESVSIANFLDHETAKIDTLIEKQQQLIKLLKEKRQAVISHAVTKGLNPQAPMKDSGVEWCDYIPEHWRIGKLGYFARVGNGATPSRENQSFWNGGTIGWLNSSKVNDVIITEAEQFITPLALAQTSVQRVKANDLVIAITGEGQTRGRVAICQLEATINQHLASIQIYDDCLHHEFLFLWLSANYERIRFESTGAGSTKGAITCGDIKSYPIVIAPLPEQKEIIKYIALQNQRFSNLMAKAETQVQLLKERRTAIISAAVTGKIDVRNWQAPTSQHQAIEQTA
ncbi:TPA: restriction endonuclease subunit S [Vibrio parahaemolyticus]|nr:restriction endonuclease subunit S [Vibrio parahaemolyticus]